MNTTKSNGHAQDIRVDVFQYGRLTVMPEILASNTDG